MIGRLNHNQRQLFYSFSSNLELAECATELAECATALSKIETEIETEIETMPRPKGTPKTGGRPKGGLNKVTIEAEEAAKNALVNVERKLLDDPNIVAVLRRLAIFVGPCRLAASSLSVFSDGTAHWRSNEVSSKNAGSDVWVATFGFFDDHNIGLWQFGTIPSPTLNPTSIVWTNDNSLFFPSYLFPSVAQVNLHSSC